MPTPSQYRYSALDALSQEIRLLHLLPASKPDDVIRCKLISVSRSKYHTPYSALSYMWGHRDADQAIELDGDSFYVTWNLWGALRQLRRQIAAGTSYRVLWIDALCINQDDPTERSSQVSRMGKIYREAQEVIVWLGDGDNTTQGAGVAQVLQFIQKMASKDDTKLGVGGDRVHEYSQKATSNSDITFNVSFLKHYQDSSYDKEWQGLARLCKMEYWNRVWIVQETVLASSLVIHCGSGDNAESPVAKLGLDWEQFIKVCQAMINLPPGWPLSEISIAVRESLPLRLNSLRKNYSNRYPLQNLLATFEDSQCLEPRDKIYGLLSLVEMDYRWHIKVDYTKPMFEVFKDVLWLKPAAVGNEFSVCAFSQLVQRTLGGPFPDKHADMVPDENSSLLDGNINGPRLLCIGAFCKNEIVPLENAYYGSVGRDIIRRKRLHTLRECFQVRHDSFDKMDALLMTALTELEEVPLGAMIPITSCYSYASKSADLFAPRPLSYDFKEREADDCGRLFLGVNGEIGLAPSCVREDDLLCQFLTSDVAAIIRPKGDHYQIIGRAVVAKGFEEKKTRYSEMSPFVFKHSVPNISPINPIYSKIYFHIDAATLQALTHPL